MVGAGATGLAVAALLLAGGCSSSPSPKASSSTTRPTTAGTGTTTGGGSSSAGSKDVKMTRCETQGTTWIMDGTVTNSSSASRSYAITVDFDQKPSGTVITSRVVSTGPIKPGDEIVFGASGAKGKTDIACVIAKVTTS